MAAITLRDGTIIAFEQSGTGVLPEVLAPVLIEFFASDSNGK